MGATKVNTKTVTTPKPGTGTGFGGAGGGGGLASTPAGDSKSANSRTGPNPGNAFGGVTGGLSKNTIAIGVGLHGGHPSPGGFKQKHIAGGLRQPPAGRGGATKAGT